MPTVADLFNDIYRGRRWDHGGTASPSGPGTTVTNSYPVMRFLTSIQPGSICDIGCGDLTYMTELLNRRIGHVHYTGVDISTEAIKLARATAPEGAVFVQGDLSSEAFEVHAHVVIAKDMLFHLDNNQVHAALASLRRSTYEFLIVNSDPGSSDHRPMNEYQWAGLDLEGPEFKHELSLLGKIILRAQRPEHGEYLFIKR